MVHATRPEFISSIMREGLTATTLSHRVTGLWCHLQTPEAEKWSHDWGRTPLDVFSGCYIGVRTPEDSFDLKTGKKSLGGKGRALVKGTTGSPEMPVRIVSVTFRIPSAALALWREKLRTCLCSCIDAHGWRLSDGTKDNAKKHLWGLLARRMCYDRNYSSETGKWPCVKKLRT